MFYNINVLQNFTMFTRKHLYRSLFIIKLLTWRSATLFKKDSTQVISCEYCKIYKNSFFYRTHPVAPSEYMVLEAVTQRCSVRTVVLRNFTKFIGKHLRPEGCNFIKKEALAQAFPCDFVKFLKTPFPTEHLWAIVLKNSLPKVLYEKVVLAK